MSMPLNLPDKYIASIFWEDCDAKAKLVYHRSTNLATFYLQTAPPIWFPVHVNFEPGDPRIIDMIDETLGVEGRKSLFGVLTELRLKVYRETLMRQFSRPKP